MGRNVSIGGLADAIMETLEDYADLAAEDVKQAVKEAGDTVRDEIRTHAPKDTGAYAKSWAVKIQQPDCGGAFQKPLSAGAPAGVRTRQAGRRPCIRSAAYRCCGSKRHGAAGG